MQIGRSSNSGVQIDRRSLVETASAMVDIPSPTGDEHAMAEHMARVFHEMGLQRAVAAGRGRPARTSSARGGAPAAARR